MKLNHLNLPVPDPTALGEFLQTQFHLKLIDIKGGGSFVHMDDGAGFTLTLLKGSSTLPQHFHIGFLLKSREEVLRVHDGLSGHGHAAQVPAEMRGGEAFGFYTMAPGEVLIEVSSIAK